MATSAWWNGDFPVTQPFGCTGVQQEPPANPNWGYGSCPHFHTGVDIGMPAGTPLRSNVSGKIITGSNPVYGNWLRIDSGRGGSASDSYYLGHLSTVLVHNGDSVAPGQSLGTSGASGDVTGAHLHFEHDVSGRPVDPTGAFGSVGSNPFQAASDAATSALDAALGPVGTAITQAEQSFVEKATYALLLVIGALLMVGGLALLAVMGLKYVPAPVKDVAETAASVTPAGRVATVAKAATPKKKPAPAGEPPQPAPTPGDKGPERPKLSIAEREPGVGYNAQKRRRSA